MGECQDVASKPQSVPTPGTRRSKDSGFFYFLFQILPPFAARVWQSSRFHREPARSLTIREVNSLTNRQSSPAVRAALDDCHSSPHAGRAAGVQRVTSAAPRNRGGAEDSPSTLAVSQRAKRPPSTRGRMARHLTANQAPHGKRWFDSTRVVPIRLHRLTARTSGFHPDNRGSIPRGDSIIFRPRLPPCGLSWAAKDNPGRKRTRRRQIRTSRRMSCGAGKVCPLRGGNQTVRCIGSRKRSLACSCAVRGAPYRFCGHATALAMRALAGGQ